ncbi:division/cell wall cluster transcriptional repressor MraZ [Alkalibacter mobilis]|uniref:division/cell wall cluster transcriptional repressor MraZ n=1 Tax=Alkalibacter mobilis TaxID=2787712 RepID=UPI00189DD1CC|nr:division/cell wall cluster transcriptional repressor MraZ [Alkalibacter mobilis]MBF7097121.1 division/cell wall cluster transcriptional repressor MraZ [Alkalibacter mobilis]
MFIGEYQHNIDAKGRLIIPSKFRDALGEIFIVTKGLDKCLFVFPMDEWHKFEEKLKTLPISSKDARAFSRFFFAGASECELDKQGRIMIPGNLRDYAGIEKETFIIGVSGRLEIWNKSNWNEYNEEDDLSYDAIADKMAMLGI